MSGHTIYSVQRTQDQQALRARCRCGWTSVAKTPKLLDEKIEAHHELVEMTRPAGAGRRR